MPSTTTRKDKKAKQAGTGAPAPEAGAQVAAEGGKLSVQGVEVDAAGAIPTGMLLPDGGTFMIVAPGTFAHDPDIDSGREPEDYEEAREHMQKLRDSMKAFAARNPQRIGNENAVICRPGADGVPVIVHGRRRDAAAKYAGTMLAVIVRHMSTTEARVSAAVENTQREDVSVLGEARQYRDLRVKDGMKVEQIAAAVGQQQAYVSKRLALLNLPEWAQAMLRTGELTEGTAYEGMARFVRVPEPAGSEMWAVLQRRWPEIKTAGVTAERIRNTLGEIARNLSRSLDPAIAYRGETAPLFDLAAHDAVCKCKRPVIRLHDTTKEHARCYDAKKWDDLQEAARADRRKALQGNGNGNGHAAPSEPAAAAEGTEAPATAKPLPAIPESAARYTAPTWTEAEEAFGVNARDHILTNDFPAAEIISAPPCKLLDVGALSADVVRIVQSPRPGLFRAVCIDAKALKAATEGADHEVKARAKRLQQQEADAFREAASKVELRAPEVLAVLCMGYGNAPGGFGFNTAALLGMDVRSAGDVSAVASLPKKELTLWLQAIAYRMQTQDTQHRSEDRERQAREEAWTDCTAEFRALLEAVGAPELTNTGRLQARAARIAGMWDDVADLIARQDGEAGAFADEVGEYAPDWAAKVEAFRAECNALASEGVAFGLDLSGISNPHGDGSLADLIGQAGALLQHPVYRVIANAARKAEAEGESTADVPQEAVPTPAEGEGESTVDVPQEAVPTPAEGEGESTVDVPQEAEPTPAEGEGESRVDVPQEAGSQRRRERQRPRRGRPQ